MPSPKGSNNSSQVVILRDDQKNYNLMQNCSLNVKNTKQIMDTYMVDMLNMFSLQFWDELFFNCVILIDIYQRQQLANISYESGKARHSELDDWPNGTLNTFANNEYSIVLIGYFVGNMIARAGMYEFFKGKVTSRVGFMMMIITLGYVSL